MRLYRLCHLNLQISRVDGVDVINTAAEQEFLMGLLPIVNQVSFHENIQVIQQRESREFLPNIVADLATESRSESLISPERRVRTETHVDTVPDATMKDVQAQSQVDSLITSNKNPEIPNPFSPLLKNDPVPHHHHLFQTNGERKVLLPLWDSILL